MRFFKKAMDPVSSETHFIGAVLSLATLVMMIIIAIIEGSDHLTIIGIIVFGLSSIALYSASCLYHYYNANEDNKIKLILRKLDHSMIYVPVSYTHLILNRTLFNNPYLWGALAAGLLLQVIILAIPELSAIFKLQPLNIVPVSYTHLDVYKRQG